MASGNSFMQQCNDVMQHHKNAHSKRADYSFHPIEGASELEPGLGGAQACEDLSVSRF